MFERHIPTLDGLRGFAALWVVYYHFVSDGLPPQITAHTGEYGVFLFFVLSGFLMGHLYLSRPFTVSNVSDYAIARVSRIVPIYYLVVLGCYVASLQVGQDFLFYITAKDLLRLLTFNGSSHVFWSVSPEVQYYAVFVLLWGFYALKPDRKMALLPLVLVGIAAVVMVQPLLPGIIVFSKLHIFVTGTLIALGASKLKPVTGLYNSWAVVAAQMLSVATIVCLTFIPNFHSIILNPFGLEPNQTYSVMYGDFRLLMLFSVILFSIAIETWFSRALFANRLMKLAGQYSFSIYLIHCLVLDAAKHIGTSMALPYWQTSVLAALFVVATGPIAYYLVERPSQNFFRKHLRTLSGKMQGRFIRKQGVEAVTA